MAGRPSGWAWHQERAAIRAHLKARGRLPEPWGEFAVDRIQRRLHREKPTMRERQARIRIVSAPVVPQFNDDELRHLVELFAQANDPTSAAIGTKAAAILEARK